MIAEFPFLVNFCELLDFLLVDSAYFTHDVHKLVANEGQLHFPLLSKLTEIYFKLWQDCGEDLHASSFYFFTLV